MTRAPTVVAELSAAQQRAVRAMVVEAELLDGSPPLSEAAVLRLSGPGGHVLVHESNPKDTDEDSDENILVAYAQVPIEGAPVELVVAPGHRRRGYGAVLVSSVVGERPVQVWAHGDLPGAKALAGRYGFRPVRELRRLARTWRTALPEVSPAGGLRLRPFDPERDADALRGVNARAFAAHPEQGGWTAEDVAARIAAPDFDATGVLIGERADGTMLGFHWTKVHATTGVGEVYVLGVDPSAQGSGLGKALLVEGLRHLRDAGVPEVELYVEADNTAALRLYEGLGFMTASVDVLYARP